MASRLRAILLKNRVEGKSDWPENAVCSSLTSRAMKEKMNMERRRLFIPAPLSTEPSRTSASASSSSHPMPAAALEPGRRAILTRKHSKFACPNLWPGDIDEQLQATNVGPPIGEGGDSLFNATVLAGPKRLSSRTLRGGAAAETLYKVLSWE